ncbi:MAG: hypothetical protein PHW74_13155 [Desulfobacca sp.]|nr:hypothetical protein [Desulfobacca sp.]
MQLKVIQGDGQPQPEHSEEEIEEICYHLAYLAQRQKEPRARNLLQVLIDHIQRRGKPYLKVAK